MRANLLKNERLNWLEKARPYVFVREENRIRSPGKAFPLDWFPEKPLYKNPLLMSNLSFGDQILRLESKAFSASNMAMPRWVFYDCAVVPGFVAGFALPKDIASQVVEDIIEPSPESEWVPISLFIIIPTMGKGEWVAHNLCSINSLLPKGENFYGLGFLTKAFGLWYANVAVCCGMTQWKSPAIRLHTHYGDFEVLTAYTPMHSYPRTLTYRMRPDPEEWARFFTGEPSVGFNEKFKFSGFQVDPKEDESLKTFQSRIEAGGGPYFLDATEIRSKPLDEPFKVYNLK